MLDLAWPIIGLNTLSILALVIDTAMCGRLPEADKALTALGFASQLLFMLLIAMMGLTIGTVAIVARAYGAGDRGRVEHVLRQSTVLTILLGSLVGLLGNLFAQPALELLGAPTPIASYALEYLRPMLWATPIYYVAILIPGVLRGIGTTRLPFFVALVANGINVGLNYGFILGNMGFPALGLPGAAYGTIASQAFTVAALVALLRRGVVDNLTFPLRPSKIDFDLARRLLQIGGPAALDMLILNAAFLSIIGMLGRIDALAVAAHAIGLRLQALAYVPGMSVSQATAAMVGQALGALDTDRARQITKVSVVLTTAIMTTLAISFLVLESPIVTAFGVDPTTRLGQLTTLWMRLLGAGFPIIGAYVAFTGTLQGSGATNTALRINAVSTLACQIPLSYLLGFTFEMGELGVWLAFPLSFVVKLGLGALAYREGSWARAGAT